MCCSGPNEKSPSPEFWEQERSGRVATRREGGPCRCADRNEPRFSPIPSIRGAALIGYIALELGVHLPFDVPSTFAPGMYDRKIAADMPVDLLANAAAMTRSSLAALTKDR